MFLLDEVTLDVEETEGVSETVVDVEDVDVTDGRKEYVLFAVAVAEVVTVFVKAEALCDSEMVRVGEKVSDAQALDVLDVVGDDDAVDVTVAFADCEIHEALIDGETVLVGDVEMLVVCVSDVVGAEDAETQAVDGVDADADGDAATDGDNWTVAVPDEQLDRLEETDAVVVVLAVVLLEAEACVGMTIEGLIEADEQAETVTG